MITTKPPGRRALLAGAAAIATPAIARAETALPDRALRIVVGFSAGGGSDTMAQLIAAALERRVGRRVAVENRPGGTGAAAGEALKLGPRDGTMVAFMPTPSLVAWLFSPAYPIDPIADLAPITMAGTFLEAFAVSPRIGVSTMAQYVQWLRDGDADRTRLGAAASDATLQFYVRLLGRELGVKLQGVPFRGTSALVSDMQDGKVPAGVAGLTSFVVPHRGGRVRILATSGSRRVAIAPDLPTAAEAGYPGLVMEEWYGFFGAAGTPAPLIEAWNRELAAVLKGRELKERLAQLGLDVETSTPSECGARLEAHLKHWRSMFEALGVKTTN